MAKTSGQKPVKIVHFTEHPQVSRFKQQRPGKKEGLPMSRKHMSRKKKNKKTRHKGVHLKTHSKTHQRKPARSSFKSHKRKTKKKQHHNSNVKITLKAKHKKHKKTTKKLKKKKKPKKNKGSHHSVHHLKTPMEKVLKGLSTVMKENQILEKEVSKLLRKSKKQTVQKINATASNITLTSEGNKTKLFNYELPKLGTVNNSTKELNNRSSNVSILNVPTSSPSITHLANSTKSPRGSKKFSSSMNSPIGIQQFALSSSPTLGHTLVDDVDNNTRTLTKISKETETPLYQHQIGVSDSLSEQIHSSISKVMTSEHQEVTEVLPEQDKEDFRSLQKMSEHKLIHHNNKEAVHSVSTPRADTFLSKERLAKPAETKTGVSFGKRGHINHQKQRKSKVHLHISKNRPHYHQDRDRYSKTDVLPDYEYPDFDEEEIEDSLEDPSSVDDETGVMDYEKDSIDPERNRPQEDSTERLEHRILRPTEIPKKHSNRMRHRKHGHRYVEIPTSPHDYDDVDDDDVDEHSSPVTSHYRKYRKHRYHNTRHEPTVHQKIRKKHHNFAYSSSSEYYGFKDSKSSDMKPTKYQHTKYRHSNARVKELPHVRYSHKPTSGYEIDNYPDGDTTSTHRIHHHRLHRKPTTSLEFNDNGVTPTPIIPTTHSVMHHKIFHRPGYKPTKKYNSKKLKIDELYEKVNQLYSKVDSLLNLESAKGNTTYKNTSASSVHPTVAAVTAHQVMHHEILRPNSPSKNSTKVVIDHLNDPVRHISEHSIERPTPSAPPRSVDSSQETLFMRPPLKSDLIDSSGNLMLDYVKSIYEHAKKVHRNKVLAHKRKVLLKIKPVISSGDYEIGSVDEGQRKKKHRQVKKKHHYKHYHEEKAILKEIKRIYKEMKVLKEKQIKTKDNQTQPKSGNISPDDTRSTIPHPRNKTDNVLHTTPTTKPIPTLAPTRRVMSTNKPPNTMSVNNNEGKFVFITVNVVL
jgi:hypothetical protein